jgi:hypothetical protein
MVTVADGVGLGDLDPVGLLVGVGLDVGVGESTAPAGAGAAG